jgi:putative nucleotidyltransferase with HDIG domain
VASTPTKPGSNPNWRSVTKSSPEYGLGSHDIDADPLELAKPQDLQQTLLKIFRSPNYKPPVLPSVAIELTELSRKTTVSYDEVVAVLQMDPLIVAGVLKVAQSPMYGGRLPVQSLKEALQRLGINTLRDVVWQVVAGMRLFRVKGYTEIMERLQAHSVFTACMARLVATKAGVAAEHAFLCGLLHDVGISGTLIALAEGQKKLPELGNLFAAIDGMHEQASGLMAKLWGLSPEIVSVVECHHHAGDLAKMPALVSILCISEEIGADLGFSLLERDAPQALDQPTPGRFERALARLKLTHKENELRAKGKELAERLV